jgi:hypothetical protein
MVDIRFLMDYNIFEIDKIQEEHKVIEITESAKIRIANSSQTSVVSNLESKMSLIAEGAIGQPFKIRLDKKRTLSGVISRCQPADIRTAGNSSIRGTFDVWMICGLNKVEKGPFRMARVPGF